MREVWTIDSVALRFKDAADTARRLPPVKVQGYVSLWPALVREEWETLAAEEPRPLRIPASPQAVERMLQTMRWVQWLPEDLRHLVWMRAKGWEWKHIGKRFGCDRTTAWRRWQTAMAGIAEHLNAQGSTTAAGCSGEFRAIQGQ